MDFREKSAGFPELMNAKGEGWLYRHVRAVKKFVHKNPELVDVRALSSCTALSRGFTKQWEKKVRTLQVPIVASNTKGAWTLRFDDVLADALEAGPLRREEYGLQAETAEAIRSADLNGVPAKVVEEVVRFYLANRREDTDWVVLPVANFDCFYGNTNFSRKWLSRIPEQLMVRSKDMMGVCRVRVSPLKYHS